MLLKRSRCAVDYSVQRGDTEFAEETQGFLSLQLLHELCVSALNAFSHILKTTTAYSARFSSQKCSKSRMDIAVMPMEFLFTSVRPEPPPSRGQALSKGSIIKTLISFKVKVLRQAQHERIEG
jgi:hypothetical protein